MDPDAFRPWKETETRSAKEEIHNVDQSCHGQDHEHGHMNHGLRNFECWEIRTEQEQEQEKRAQGKKVQVQGRKRESEYHSPEQILLRVLAPCLLLRP